MPSSIVDSGPLVGGSMLIIGSDRLSSPKTHAPRVHTAAASGRVLSITATSFSYPSVKYYIWVSVHFTFSPTMIGEGKTIKLLLDRIKLFFFCLCTLVTVTLLILQSCRPLKVGLHSRAFYTMK